MSCGCVFGKRRALDSIPLTSGAHAAQVWLEGEASAELQAIAMTARHRLERGIWTSPGAGAPCTRCPCAHSLACSKP